VNVPPAPNADLTVTDLKQWACCQRIPFYRYVLPLRPAATYKMERGKAVQGAGPLGFTPDACYPVDFKDTEGGVRRNHRLQLAAYALLAEETFARPATQGFIYLVPERRAVAVDLVEADRQQVRDAVAAIRCMIAREETPLPATVRARCRASEFQNYCGDHLVIRETTWGKVASIRAAPSGRTMFPDEEETEAAATTGASRPRRRTPGR
jgi:CRISPR-associated exonuclease Cas4